jgi:hypothetical protein
MVPFVVVDLEEEEDAREPFVLMRISLRMLQRGARLLRALSHDEIFYHPIEVTAPCQPSSEGLVVLQQQLCMMLRCILFMGELFKDSPTLHLDSTTVDTHAGCVSGWPTALSQPPPVRVAFTINLSQPEIYPRCIGRMFPAAAMECLQEERNKAYEIDPVD